MIVPIQKNRIFEDVSNQMIALIESGVWKEGEKIMGEIELSKEFKISRNSIREAIKALQMRGVLEAKSGLGTFVASNAVQKIQDTRLVQMLADAEYYDEILEARYLIETEMVFWAAKLCNDNDIAFLERNQELLEKVTEENNSEEIIKYGHEFHSYIVNIPHNRIISSFYQSLTQQLIAERSEYGTRNISPSVGNGEHKKIIEAFKRKDAYEVRRIMQNHLVMKMRGNKLRK